MATAKSQPVTTPANIHPDFTAENIAAAESIILAIFTVVSTGQVFASTETADFVFRLIDRLRSGLAVSSAEFDKALTLLRSTNGTDFLPEISHFRKPREDKDRAAKPVDIFAARAKRK